MGYKETRCIIEHKLVKQTKDCCIIETNSENLDAPSCDTFRVLNTSMVVGSPKAPEKSMLIWFCYVNFVKFSFVKVVINSTTLSAVLKQYNQWCADMEKEGLLKSKPKPAPEPIVESPQKREVQTNVNESPVEMDFSPTSDGHRKNLSQSKYEERKNQDREEKKQRSEQRQNVLANMNLTIMDHQNDQLDCDIQTQQSRLTCFQVQSQYSLKDSIVCDRRSVMAQPDNFTTKDN